MNPKQPPGPRVVIARSSRKEILLGVVAGLVVICLVLFAILNMNREVVGKGIVGRITEKNFTPEEPSTEITLGREGVRARQVDGIYTFVVWVENEKKYYTIWVDKELYNTKKVGDTYYFLRPPRAAE